MPVRAEQKPPQIIAVSISYDLYHRLTVIRKRLHKTISDLARDAVQEKLDALEEKFRREDALRDMEKLTQRQRVGRAKELGVLSEIGENGVGSGDTPDQLDPLPMIQTPSAAPKRDPLEKVYEDLAKTILPVVDQPDEVKRRAKAAVEAVKKYCPLTHPSEPEILATLERVVVRLRDTLPATPAFSTVATPVPSSASRTTEIPLPSIFVPQKPDVDDRNWKTIDTKGVRSFGDQ